MSKSIFSAALISGLIVCSTLAAAVSTASLGAAAGSVEIVTLPTVNVVGKRTGGLEVVTLPTVTIVAHRDTAVQVASR